MPITTSTNLYNADGTLRLDVINLLSKRHPVRLYAMRTEATCALCGAPIVQGRIYGYISGLRDGKAHPRCLADYGWELE